MPSIDIYLLSGVHLGGTSKKTDFEIPPTMKLTATIIKNAKQKHFNFLTNNFTISAMTIAEFYRHRWQMELFFKWIKQHLRIKSFFGVTENAVKSRIWIAISVYVLIAIIKKCLSLESELYTILQILSLSLFEKTPLD